VTKPKPILLLVLGDAPESLVHTHGTFVNMFERVADERFVVHDGRLGRLERELRDFAGMIITGSSSSLAVGAVADPWVDDCADLIVRADDLGVPVLGVCFGHQLVGYAFGARVIVNPKGYEIGTRAVELTDAGRADPLFAGLPPRIRTNLTHFDVVVEPPARVRQLARNDMTELQAIAVGDHVRGVQFHPEFDGAIMRSYVDARRAEVRNDDPDVLRAEASDCPESEHILRNFRVHFVGRS